MTQYLTVKDLAKELRVSRTTAYRIAAAVGFSRVSRGAIRIDRSALAAYLTAQAESPATSRQSALAEAKRLAQAAVEALEKAERL